jgi:hypothetical protein
MMPKTGTKSTCKDSPNASMKLAGAKKLNERSNERSRDGTQDDADHPSTSVPLREVKVLK